MASRTLSLRVEAPQAGQRLDKFLGGFEEIGSRSRAAMLIEAGAVRSSNGSTPKPSHVICEGEVFSVAIPEPQKSDELIPLDLKLDIVFEDDEILVVNKPAGLVVHPAAGHAQDTLVNAILHHNPNIKTGHDALRPGIVHRLDKDTSGLMVIAKTDHALRNLSAQFKDRTAGRVYFAIVYGTPKKSNGRIESSLGRHPTDRKRFATVEKDGRIAVTNYQVITTSALEKCSLVQLKLETGRTHQIRVHLSELGHPIIGDSLYGGGAARAKSLKSKGLMELIRNLPRFALHAAQLELIHPRTLKKMRFEAPWPQDLVELKEKVGL